MTKKRTSSVAFTDSVWVIMDDLTPVFGTQKLIAGGVLLFNKLTLTEQKALIQEVNKLSAADRQSRLIVASAQADAAKLKQTQVRKSSKAG